MKENIIMRNTRPYDYISPILITLNNFHLLIPDLFLLKSRQLSPPPCTLAYFMSCCGPTPLSCSTFTLHQPNNTLSPSLRKSKPYSHYDTIPHLQLHKRLWSNIWVVVKSLLLNWLCDRVKVLSLISFDVFVMRTMHNEKGLPQNRTV